MSRTLLLAGLLLGACMTAAVTLGCRGGSADAPRLVVGPPEIDFGSVHVGSRAQRVLVLTNPGDAPLGVRRISVEAPFGVSKSSLVLGAGESHQLAVVYVADASGEAQGTLVVEDAAGGVASVEVRGAARRPAEVALDPLGLSFGEVQLGGVARAQLVARNLGDEELRLEQVAASGAFAVEASASAVAPGGELTLEVSFAPTRAGPQEASLVVRTNDPVRRRLAVHLRGTGLARPPAPAIELGSLVLDFGSVSSCRPHQQTLSIHNAGEDPLTVASVSIARPFAGPRGSRRIPPGRSLELPVYFAPVQTGPAVAPLLVHSNDPEAPVVVVSLTGDGRLETDCRVARDAEAGDDAAQAPVEVARVGGAGGAEVLRDDPPPDAGVLEEPGGDDAADEAEVPSEPGPPPGPPAVREGSLVSLGTYRGDIGPAHVDAVTLLPSSGQLALEGVQLPRVELPFDEFFEFEPIDVVGDLNGLGEVEFQVPVEMLDQDGNRTQVPLTLTTGASATVTRDGTLVTLQGEPLGADGNASLVGTVTLPGGGLEGLAMGVVLNVHAQP